MNSCWLQHLKDSRAMILSEDSRDNRMFRTLCVCEFKLYWRRKWDSFLRYCYSSDVCCSAARVRRVCALCFITVRSEENRGFKLLLTLIKPRYRRPRYSQRQGNEHKGTEHKHVKAVDHSRDTGSGSVLNEKWTITQWSA